MRTLALLAVLVLATGCAGLAERGREPEAVIVRFVLDDTGLPSCRVIVGENDTTHYLSDADRVLVANRLIRDRAPNYCAAE